MRPPVDGVLLITQLFASNLADKPYTLPDGQAVLGHTGVDVNAPLGTPVKAAWPGTVSHGWDATGFGNYVVLTDPHGRQALYGHLESFATKDGATVGPSEIIGYAGSTGNSSGSHVHLEVVNAGTRDMENGFRGCHDWIADLDHAYVHLLDLRLV